jgi:hypothetical protein
MVRHVILRVWVTDRPGSLGRLATRIGGLGCDLIGIDVLERDGARAADELTVELPVGFDPDALVEGVSSLPGVEFEDLRYLVSRVPEAERDPMEAAVLLAASRSAADLLESLPRGVCAAFACDWSTVLDVGHRPACAVGSVGAAPSAEWLEAFIGGMKACGPSSSHTGAPIGPRDVAWAALDSSDLVVVVGRDGPPFRSRERRQLQQLCRIADARWMDVVQRGTTGSAAVQDRAASRRLAAS